MCLLDKASGDGPSDDRIKMIRWGAGCLNPKPSGQRYWRTTHSEGGETLILEKLDTAALLEKGGGCPRTEEI